MVGRMLLGGLFLAICGINTLTGSVALVRDPTVVAAQSYQGAPPVTIQLLTPATDINLIILGDTLTGPDIIRLRRELGFTFSSAFLTTHVVRMMDFNAGSGSLTEPLRATAALQAALKPLLPASKSPASVADMAGQLAASSLSLPKDWSHVVFIGHFPAPTPEDQQSSAWLTDLQSIPHDCQATRASPATRLNTAKPPSK